LIHPSLPTPPPRGAARAVPCGLDRHFGPFELLPELKDWLGADWCRCRACRSTLTIATALRQRFAA
jgi:hypothetical protein